MYAPPFCRQCLLDAQTDSALRNQLTAYLDHLPPETKALSEEYDRRLALCMDCGHLINGLCALCGCFVEIRAAKQGQHCADVRQRW